MNHDKRLYSTLENVSLILQDIIPDLQEIVDEKELCGNKCRSCKIAQQVLNKTVDMMNFAHEANKEINRLIPVESGINSITTFNPERDTI